MIDPINVMNATPSVVRDESKNVCDLEVWTLINNSLGIDFWSLLWNSTRNPVKDLVHEPTLRATWSALDAELYK